jgi:HlyD family secretion protein/epimerase transport system membrane fusion protein
VTTNNELAPPKADSTAERWTTAKPTQLLRGPVVVGYIIVLLFFGGLGTWAALAPVAGAVIASGVVSPDGSRKKVQHLEGGIIDRILVDDGDRVQTGDALVVLQETQARAAFEVLQGQRGLLAAQLARLLAEQANRDQVTFADWLLAQEADDVELGEILQGQRDLFTARHKLHEGRKLIGLKRVDELREEITSLREQAKSQREQLQYLAEELEAKKPLLDRGMLPRPDFLALQRLRAEIEGELAENIGRIASAKQKIGETKLQVVNEDAVRLEKIVSDLAETRSELASVEERLLAQRDILKRTVIVAPVAGVIMQMRFHTTGGVVGPGEPVLDIVPQDVELLIDARVQPVDIDEVTTGQQARVHFLAYSERNLPQIHGTVRSVSADSLLDEISGQSYYLARVEVPPKELEKLGEDITITPGMPAEVLIMTGERTVLQYLVQPLIDSLRRTFRES